MYALQKIFEISKQSLLTFNTNQHGIYSQQITVKYESIAMGFFPYTRDQFTQEESPGPARMTAKARTPAKQAPMRLISRK
jgi:hypothetical protein